MTRYKILAAEPRRRAMSCRIKSISSNRGCKIMPTYKMSFAHSPTFPSLHLCHNSFSNPSFGLPISQLILQTFRRFTHVTAHSPTLLSLHLRHRLCSFSNLSVASPMSQLILQPFYRFSYVTESSLTVTYVTVHSPTLLSLLLRHKLFT